MGFGSVHLASIIYSCEYSDLILSKLWILMRHWFDVLDNTTTQLNISVGLSCEPDNRIFVARWQRHFFTEGRHLDTEIAVA